jgi:hypothetical protein
MYQHQQQQQQQQQRQQQRFQSINRTDDMTRGLLNESEWISRND